MFVIDLQAFGGICRRSEKFMVVQPNLWSFSKTYGRSAEFMAFA